MMIMPIDEPPEGLLTEGGAARVNPSTITLSAI